ncbi:MAG: DUF1697 domain-containing protein, partial [Treponema sp.]|nr:DUF1697 domain-containing protein [Treponema sp.]
MNKYLVLLRGINVGGNNIIKMAGLQQTFEEMLFVAVKTYIQSGNVICSADEKDKTQLTQIIEKKLSKTYNYDARVVILTFAELKKVVTVIPAGFGDDPETYRYDVWFVKEPATADDVMSIVKIREGVDWVYKGKQVVYTQRLMSQAAKSRLTKIIQEPVYQNLTIRNWNTTKKLFE